MTEPIDPPAGPEFALSGRIVTMNAIGKVIADGVLYGQAGSIVAVQDRSAPPPAGFESVRVVATGGTIFPGLIELHNHLPYDVLGLWEVPKLYGNRDQWSGPSTPAYHQQITGPMAKLGASPDVVAAIVRYTEVRCLLGGTTTSQGVTLSSDPGLISHFRGLVRNVESTGDPALPNAATHIADVAATDAAKFLAAISTGRKMILHLSEGTDRAAADHFAALQVSPGQWAITENLIGIHCVALTDDDFAVFAAHGGSMVWSPLSNLLLYGQTAKLGSALAHDVPVALGSDWSPSGSKNLLGELKVARLAAPAAGAIALTDADLVAMATRTPAQMLGWGGQIGTLETGKRADLLVIPDAPGDPHTRLIDATEADILLVMINGLPRVGTKMLLDDLGCSAGLEAITVDGQLRYLNLAQSTADLTVEPVTVTEALARLTAALQALPTSSASQFVPSPGPGARKWTARLAVSGLVDDHQSPCPHLPLYGKLTGPNLPATQTIAATRAAVSAAGPLPALTLDPLTAVDNPAFYDTLAAEQNLPAAVRSGLATYRHN